jgi:hypothetical protein
MLLIDPSSPLAQAPPDHEWLKILASATVGLFVGLFADPIRNLIQIRINTVRMERAIQFDFLNLWMAMKTVEEDNVPASEFWRDVELPAFDYFWERNRELFYVSLELQPLRLNCMTVQRLKALVEDGRKTPEEALAKLSAIVNQVKGHQKPLNWRRQLIFRFVR